MKKSFKLLFLFFVFATTFLSGCSEEIYDDHLHEQKQNITTRRIKSDELFRDKKVVVELNNVKSFLSSENQLSNQRLVNFNGYIIETDDVLLTEYAGIKSYTFPIYEINAEKLKNLVIAEKLDGTYVSKIFEYDLTPSEKIDLENDELKTIQNPVNVLRFSNETFGCGFETIIVYIPCSQGVHDSSNLNDWGNCRAGVQPSIKVIERLVGCDDGGGGGSLLNTTGSNPIDYTPVGGSSSLNNNFPNESTNPNDFENGITQPVLTSIDGISEVQLNINLFHINLDSEQQDWVNENNNTYNQIIQYLINTNQGNNIWSVESKEFAKELIDLAIAETNQADVSNLVNISLIVEKGNYYYNDFDLNFINQIDPFVDLDLSDQDMQDPLVTHLIIKYNMLKALNPSWSKTKLVWETVKDVLHTGLDVFGLFPVFGEPADLINGVIYTLEGEHLNAGMSYAGAIPVLGWVSTSTKVGLKVVNAATTITTKVKLTWKVLPNGNLFFGSNDYCRKQLRKVLGMAVGNGLQAHHIIPLNLQTNEIVQKAAKSGSAFHMNEALNGIPLSTAVHSGSHGNYDAKIAALLNALPANATPTQCYNKVNEVINKVRTAIANNPNTPINQLNF